MIETSPAMAEEMKPRVSRPIDDDADVDAVMPFSNELRPPHFTTDIHELARFVFSTNRDEIGLSDRSHIGLTLGS